MKVHQYTMMCAPIQGQMAAIEALRSGDRAVEETREEYNRRRHLMVRGLNRLGLSCLEPQGAFYTFPSIKSLDMSSEEFAERLLMEEKVALVPGSAFGPSRRGARSVLLRRRHGRDRGSPGENRTICREG